MLRLAAQGTSQLEIAKTLDLSTNTVKTHLRHVAEKLGAASRAEALQMATDRDLVPDVPHPPDRDALVAEVLRLATAQGLLPAGHLPWPAPRRDPQPRR